MPIKRKMMTALKKNMEVRKVKMYITQWNRSQKRKK